MNGDSNPIPTQTLIQIWTETDSNGVETTKLSIHPIADCHDVDRLMHGHMNRPHVITSPPKK